MVPGDGASLTVSILVEGGERGERRANVGRTAANGVTGVSCRLSWRPSLPFPRQGFNTVNGHTRRQPALLELPNGFRGGDDDRPTFLVGQGILGLQVHEPVADVNQ